MTPPTNFQRPLPDASAKLSSTSGPIYYSSWQQLGAELVFTQDATGRYGSFYWQEAERQGLNFEEIPAEQLSEIFAPVEVAAYLQKVQLTLASLLPTRFSCEFLYGEQVLPFDLVISPILMPTSTATTVLVMGCHRQPLKEKPIPKKKIPATYPTPGELISQQYQKLLTQIARNIRRTLDLDTIWQQTVNGLGQALNTSRCIVCSYKTSSSDVSVVAEYCQEDVPSLSGKKFKLKNTPYLMQAIETLEPVVLEQPENQANPQQLMLVVATHYKNNPNGLISLYQIDQVRQWQTVEIELVREIAEQVGTAIAHATLYEELKEARQQAEESSRLKSEFLASTSHELRTPLNGMLGSLKIILDGMAEDPEEQQEFIEEAYRSALHLLNIINDILDIAKIEAGKMELELGPVRLKELFNDVENFTKTQAQQKCLSLRLLLPAAHDEIIVYGNYQRLLQVMINLVGNAIKFTHEGGVTITAEILLKKKFQFKNQEFPGWVKVRVADTGIGVSLDKQDKLFQKFTQVDGGLTRQYGGTGLGLTISQKLVETMGGTVNFYSMGDGLGSTVTFTVPLYQEPLMIPNQQPDTIDVLNFLKP